MEFFVVLNHNSPISMSLWQPAQTKIWLTKNRHIYNFSKCSMHNNSQVNDKHITSCEIKTHDRSNLILVRLGTDPMKHGTSTLFFILNCTKTLLWDDYYEIGFCFQERDRWEYLSASCRGEVWTFHVSTTKVNISIQQKH